MKKKITRISLIVIFSCLVSYIFAKDNLKIKNIEGTKVGAKLSSTTKLNANFSFLTLNVGNAQQAVAVDCTESVWFSNYQFGVSKYDTLTKTFTPYSVFESGICSNFINGITFDSKGNGWFASDFGGVSKFDGKNWTTFTSPANLPSKNVYTIREDKNGKMWFGTAAGLTVFDGTNWTTYTTANGLPQNVIKSIAFDSKGNTWIGTYGSGLVKYDGTIFTTYNTTNGLLNNNVVSLDIDKNDNIWIGTWGGLNKFNGSTFTSYTTTNSYIISNWINCIKLDKFGNVVIGTNSGISYFNGTSFMGYNTTSGLSNNNVLSLSIDKSQNFWFGTNSATASKLVQSSLPAPPYNVTAVTGKGSATISFTRSAFIGTSAITGFKVVSNPDGIVATGTGSPIKVSGLTPNVNYTFTVIAINSNGESVSSSPSNSVLIDYPVVPSVPTNISVVPSTNKMTVSFVAPTNDGGSTITGYTVTVMPGNTTFNGLSSPISVTGLSKFTAYTFSVTANNAVGSSLPSSVTNQFKLLSEPIQPTNLLGVSDNTSALLYFNAPTFNGGSAITKYTLKSNPGNIQVNGTTSPIKITGLTNGTPYTFTITATNIYGTSVESSISNVITPIALTSDSLLAHYTFDGNANDLTGNGNNGVISGNLNFIQDEGLNSNAAAEFNGTNSFITIPRPNRLKFPSGASFTIIAKVKSTLNTGKTNTYTWTNGQIFSKYAGAFGSSSEFTLLYVNYSGGNSACSVRDNVISNTTVSGIKNNFNKYITIACVKNAKDKTLKLYEDGVLVRSISLASTFADLADVDCFLGKQNLAGGGEANFFKGVMDDLKIYSRALTPVELSSVLTDLKEETSSNKIYIGSNPSSNEFKLFTTENLKVNVLNVNGEVVDSFETNSDFIFGSQYYSGVYFVKIESASNQDIIKIVKY